MTRLEIRRADHVFLGQKNGSAFTRRERVRVALAAMPVPTVASNDLLTLARLLGNLGVTRDVVDVGRAVDAMLPDGIPEGSERELRDDQCHPDHGPAVFA